MGTKKSKKAPAPRKAKQRRKKMTPKEIAIIKAMTKAGATMRTIAKKVGRVPSVVWRVQNS